MSARRVLRCLPLLVVAIAACTSNTPAGTKAVAERKVSSQLPKSNASKEPQAPNAGVLTNESPSPSPTAGPSPSPTPTPTPEPSPSPTAKADTGASGTGTPKPSPSPTAGPGSAPSPTPAPGSSPAPFSYIRALLPTYHLETDSTSQFAVVAGSAAQALLIPNGADVNVVVSDGTTVQPYSLAGPLGGAIANLQAIAVDGAKAYTVATVGGTFQLITLAIDPATFAATATATPITGATLKRIGGLVLKDATTLIAADTQNSAIFTINIADGAATLYAGTAGAVGTTTGAAADTKFAKPTSLSLDGTKLYVLDSINNRVVLGDLATNTFSVLVGAAGNGNADGDFASAKFTTPQSMCRDGQILYVADTGNSAVRALDLTAKTVSTFSILGGGTVLPFGRGLGVLGTQIYGADNAGDVFSFRASL